MMHYGLWAQLLPKLQLRTIYRLLILNKEVNLVFSRENLWKMLITRDLGIIPDYITNYKWYYLKQMRFNVPLSLYTIDKNNIVTVDTRVLDSEEEYELYSDRIVKKIRDKEKITESSAQLRLGGTSIVRSGRCLGEILSYDVWSRPHFSHPAGKVLITTDGRLYDYSGRLVVGPKLPDGEIIKYINHEYHNNSYVVSKSGKLYRFEWFGRSYSKLVLITQPKLPPIVDGSTLARLILKSGLIYDAVYDRYLTSSDDLQPRLNANGELDIDDNGIVRNLGEIPFRLGNKLKQYFIINIHRTDNNQYVFRGFKL